MEGVWGQWNPPSQVRTGRIRRLQKAVVPSACSMACVLDGEASQTTAALSVGLMIDKSVKMFSIHTLETVCPRLHFIPVLIFQFIPEHLSFPSSLFFEIITLD